jgi:dihydroorotate dehydrogenase (NAD+) catalytic subunit
MQPKPKLSINIGKLKLRNPVIVCSGTFGYAEEFRDFINLKDLGAIVTKTITLKPRQGNLPPRTCETPAGMLNSIGLENPGIDNFIEEKLPILEKASVPIIISIASEESPEEFIMLAQRINRIKGISAIELNISCPNLKKTKLISQDAKSTYRLVKSTRKITRKTLITKLSPNVTDIVGIAQAAERAGSDAVSLINTLTGMCVDIESRRPKLGAITGGLSGPAIRPIAVRMVYEIYQKIKIPIIGMGGIIDASSALEFIISGATAVSIGTANFIDPGVTIKVIEGIKEYLVENKIKDLRSLTGSLKA